MRLFFTIISIMLYSAVSGQKLAVYGLTTDHRVNPVGIESPQPRLSWKINAPGRNVLQTAYIIRVASAPDFAKEKIVWESGKQQADQSVLHPFGGKAEPGMRYFWQVKVWDNQKRESAWSEAAFWEMGLDEQGWKASWIYPKHDTSLYIPAIMVRKEFAVNKAVASARMYITSLGMYELSMNGAGVGDEVLTPGWTSYNNRLQYQVYDVTRNLRQGNNAVGVMIGNGWYRSNLGWAGNWGIWGKQLGLICQLNITYADGSTAVVTSDDSWKSSNSGPVVMTGIYEGETYDARKEIPDWNKPGFNDSNWSAVPAGKQPPARLVATETVPVKRIQEIVPVKIFRTKKGTLVADFGQNMVGWVRLKVNGSAGTTVTIRHAEVLDKYTEFYTENLRGAEATMRYTLKGSGQEVYEPKFTFFGFRFIAVDGFPGELKPENITGVVVHSDMPVTGTFETSNPLVNQLQKNIQWGQKGNFVDVPTDCPQRDERLGWTGDAQVFGRTAAYNMNVAAFFSKWLKDLAADQLKDGTVPPVIPNIMLDNIAGSAGWADASTILPWEMYQMYGDRKFLEEQYPSMKAWVGYIDSKSKNNLWNTGFHFGDWLFYRPFDDLDGRSAVTDKFLIAQCFWAHSTTLVASAAEVLGKTEDVQRYKQRLKEIKDAFNREYVTGSGRLVSGTQTAYVLALHFDMLPENLRASAAERLAANVKDYGNHLTTGFLGTPYLCHVLTRYGYNDVAYSLLLQETYPSWLYPVKMGATTIWERWDGQKPDSTFQNAGMNSFNHYAYGAIGDWMYRVSAGLQSAAPGYKKILIAPRPDKRLGYARATYESPYGLIGSGWERKDGKVIVSVRIPANTTARIEIPSPSGEELADKTSRNAGGKITREGNVTIVDVGSGEYRFSYPEK